MLYHAGGNFLLLLGEGDAERTLKGLFGNDGTTSCELPELPDVGPQWRRTVELSCNICLLSKQDSKLVLGIWLHLERRLLCGSRLEIEESSNGEIKG